MAQSVTPAFSSTAAYPDSAGRSQRQAGEQRIQALEAKLRSLGIDPESV